MNAALAKALAREAIKKKPDLAKAEINEKEPEPEKEPERLVGLKKATVQEKKAPEVNTSQLPKVELKKSEVVEKKAIEVNSGGAPLAKVQLKKAEIKERPNIPVNASPSIKVELKKTPEMHRTEGGAEARHSTVPSVSLRHREVDDKASAADHPEEPKMMVNLRKPGKGRFKNLEQYYQN